MSYNHDSFDTVLAPYAGPERRQRKPVFNMRFGDFDVVGAARHMLGRRRSVIDGMGLFVTPNIQHIALAQEDEEFADALRSAQLVVADGFPVYRFALMRGLYLPGRVTGREVVEAMFADPALLAGHRAFFVVDSEETAAMLQGWAGRFAGLAVHTHVPPFGFDRDPSRCLDLVNAITDFNTSLLFLCVGAPRSEVFAHRYRRLLPPCWALCVGQSFRLMIGLNQPPPALFVKLNLEWAWRILLEPKRMLARYGPSALGFLRAALGEMIRKPQIRKTRHSPFSKRV